MKILVTGAKGFVGKNLVCALKNIQNGKDKARPNLKIEEIFEYGRENTEKELDEYCKRADFVFNLAGVNKSQDVSEFKKANFGFASLLLEKLKKYNNKCPVMLASSVQATLIGRYNNEYGKSKKMGEELFFDYSKETGAKVLVYRLPNLFGKWCKPNYNSVVATFCHNIANDLPIVVHDKNTILELLYIDDLVGALIDSLEGKEYYAEFDGVVAIAKEKGRYCYCLGAYQVSLGEIANLLETFRAQSHTLVIPEIPDNSFVKKLYSTYMSYLPKEKVAFLLKMNIDERGSFTELLKTENCGQFSVNIIKPNTTKGEHWHNSKWEFFIVVSGDALIKERKIGTEEVLQFNVSGEKLQAVQMLTGYTHNITNLSETKDLVVLIWANEQFDPNHPDTYCEKVDKNED